jgi:uncharacterized membrane protein YozB (DUF420 family)
VTTAAATLALLLIGAGILFRRDRHLHVPLIITAFAIDLTLVLYVELSKHAVESVLRRGGALLWFHALVSALMFVLYLVQIALGLRILRGNTLTRRTHRRVGVAFVCLRLINYVTSFMV